MSALRPQRALLPNSGLGRTQSEKVCFVVIASNPLESRPFYPTEIGEKESPGSDPSRRLSDEMFYFSNSTSPEAATFYTENYSAAAMVAFNAQAKVENTIKPVLTKTHRTLPLLDSGH